MIGNSKFNQNSKFKIQNFNLSSFPKFLTTLFLLIFILQLVCWIVLTLAPQASQAAEPAVFKPQIEIPGLEKEFSKDPKTGGYILPSDTGGIAKYVRAIYKYAIGIVGILAAVVLMIGGVMWIMAGGSATMIGEAKAWIGASLTGLTLALLSYLILATVNPALVELRTTTIKKVEPAPGNFDASVPCGQLVQGQNIICGSLCPAAGQTCKSNKAFAGMSDAKECPPNSGNVNYYRCDDCCKNNQDADCPTNSNYICNRNNTSRCPGQGICTLKQPKDGVCDENEDCQSNKCSLSSTFGTLRCE